MTGRVQTGLERLALNPRPHLKDQRIGLLCNPASVDPWFNHARECIDRAYPGQLAALFAPQHGFYAAQQDNMIESDDSVDPCLGIPVFSLYGRTRIPTPAMFDTIDTLLIDLQDTGTRVYTFIYTMSFCLEAAKRFGKKVVVLDRPNPVNGIQTEGNLLHPDLASFVGRYPLPMRHGLTIAELARLFNEAYGIGCDLEVIPMQGWSRSMFFTDTRLPWVAPSPNLPTPASALVYPGQVLWEGTNLSEGRGTTQPFELFGAPFVDLERLQAQIDYNKIPGAMLRPTVFEPTSNKWSGQACKGFQIHVINPDIFKPYDCSLLLLQQIIGLFPQDFQWKRPPYEYEYEKLPIDLIIGNRSVRKQLENLENLEDITAAWQDELAEYNRMRRDFLLYT